VQLVGDHLMRVDDGPEDAREPHDPEPHPEHDLPLLLSPDRADALRLREALLQLGQREPEALPHFIRLQRAGEREVRRPPRLAQVLLHDERRRGTLSAIDQLDRRELSAEIILEHFGDGIPLAGQMILHQRHEFGTRVHMDEGRRVADAAGCEISRHCVPAECLLPV
jgi:hypothetical protein